MSATSGGIAPFNWPALVSEAIRRRKAEKMTQKEHAALAGVSIPTIIAFDRAERTLSLGKAIDILRVVGLVEEVSTEETQEAFVREAFTRWQNLTKDLDKESPGRFPLGWYRVDYAIEGNVRDIEPHRLRDFLAQAVVPHTGWPMFRLPRRTETAAREVDGVLECWLRPDQDRPFISDPAHCDFWRASPTGRLFLIRGYQEDAQETFPPGTIFDVSLPIWRIAEALLHAARLTKLLARQPESADVRMRISYTGLQGRDLRAWASPGTIFHGGSRSRSDEVMTERTISAATIETNLTQLVMPFIEPLYERFGVTGTAPTFIDVELERMRGNDFSDRTSALSK